MITEVVADEDSVEEIKQQYDNIDVINTPIRPGTTKFATRNQQDVRNDMMSQTS